MSYKTYENYKDSGIEWIGNIPQDWSVIKLKYLLDVISGGCWGEEDADDSGTLVLRSTEITLDGKWNISEPAKRKLKNEEVSKCLLKENDLLVTKSSGSEKHIGKTAIVTKDVESLNCCFSNFMTRLHTNKLFNPKLLYYLLNSVIVKSQFNYMSNSTVGLSNLNDESFKRLLLPFSDMKFQNIIVDFLDKKTSVIDDNITKNEDLISLLEEKKVALINQVVTKGLDQNVHMKDSGIEWVGEIPEHWELKRLKNVSDVIMGQSPSSEDINYDGDGICFMQGNAEFGFKYPEPTSFCTNPKKISRKGDILMSVRAPVGALNISDKRYCIGRGLCSIKSVGILSSYLWYFLIYSKSYLDFFSNGSTFDAITVDTLLNLPICLPPSSEQEQIVNYLDKEIPKIDEIISKIWENIDLLNEYKASLIYHVVTGKIDVRDEV